MWLYLENSYDVFLAIEGDVIVRLSIKVNDFLAFIYSGNFAHWNASASRVRTMQQYNTTVHVGLPYLHFH